MGHYGTYIHTCIHKFMITIYTYLCVTAHKDINKVLSAFSGLLTDVPNSGYHAIFLNKPGNEASHKVAMLR